MKIKVVDPRDVSWQVDHPAYRVYFWQSASEDDAQAEDVVVEYELTDTDIDGVIEWASQRRSDGRYVIYVTVPDPSSGLGLVRLSGTEPELSR